MSNSLRSTIKLRLNDSLFNIDTEMRESEGKRKRKGEREQDRERDKRELLGVR